MERRETEKIAPVDFLLAVAIAGGSGAAFLFPALSSRMVYDREAILQGELWRIYTGHLVHFSPSHLIYNLLGVILLVTVARHRNHRGLRCLLSISAATVSGSIFLLEPEMAFYGGLSGIAHALMAYVACRLLADGKWRLPALLVLTLATGNMVLEAASGTPILASSGEAGFTPAVLAHVAGALTGAVMAFAQAAQGGWFASFKTRGAR